MKGQGVTAAGAVFRLAVVCAIGLGAACPAVDAANDHTVRVGLYDNAPKIYVDKDGQPAGLFVTLIREISHREGWKLVFEHCQWKVCLERLENGDIDLMPDVAFTEERDRRFDFHSIPVAYSWSVILKRKDTPSSSLSELTSARIAVLAGAVQGGALAKMMDGLNLSYTTVPYQSYARAFEAVRDGEADAVAANNFFAAYFSKQYELRETPIVFDPATLYYAVNEGDPRGLLAPIDEHLDAWRQDEGSIYYEALRTAMIPARTPEIPRLVRYLLAGALLLLCLFLVMSGVLRWQVRRRTRELRKTAHRLDHMLRSSPVVLYQLAVSGGYVDTRWVSDNVERLFGLPAAGFITDDGWSRHLHPEDRETVMNNIGALPERGHLVQEYRIVDGEGKARFVRDEMQFLPGRRGESDEVHGSWNDLTHTREQAARLSFLTNYDPLTRLPNRALFRERLSGSVNRARQEKRSLAVVFIDIDRFRGINDSFGRHSGDMVLKEVANRLSGVLGVGENLARIGNDCFVVLMEDAGRRQAVAMTSGIMKRFVDPVQVGDQDVVLTLSAGICLFPEAGGDADTLLQHAEAAKNEAKRAGRNAYRFYYTSMSVGSAERLAVESALRSAVGNQELMLHYQPQVELNTTAVVGVEALVRWQHPKLGMVSPGRFIPVAEEMGIIGEIGAWVLKEACRQMMAWRREGLPVPRVSVNLSVQQLDSETLLPLVRRVLSRTGLDASSLELEVTESMIMREPEKASAALRGIRAMGIGLAIDDFGTSYSSLNYLRHLPIDRLKIDRSFVRDIGTDLNSRAISRTIINLAHSLELEAVAEGIEEVEQLEFLRDEGCSFGQGFLFSAPVPAGRMPDVCHGLGAAPVGGAPLARDA